MIVLGLMVGDTPVLDGTEFSQYTMALASSMTMLRVNLLNGMVLLTPHILSFIVRISLSTSPTCSSHDVVFNVTCN